MNAPFTEREHQPEFSTPWQAHAYSLAMLLHHAGHLDGREWSSAFGDVPHSPDDYHRWLEVLEGLLIEKGLLSAEQLQAEQQDLRLHWPHPEHVARREPIARSLPIET